MFPLPHIAGMASDHKSLTRLNGSVAFTRIAIAAIQCILKNAETRQSANIQM